MVRKGSLMATSLFRGLGITRVEWLYLHVGAEHTREDTVSLVGFFSVRNEFLVETFCFICLHREVKVDLVAFRKPVQCELAHCMLQ